MKKLLLLIFLTGCASQKVFKPVEPVTLVDKVYIYNSNQVIYNFVDGTGCPFISIEKYGYHEKKK